DAGSLHDVPMQGFAAQIEEAVFEPNILRIVRLAENGQRQFLRHRQHLDLLRKDLDLASLEIRVDGFLRTRLHLAVHPDHPLAADLLRHLERRRIRVGDDLGHAVVIAQVDEEKPTMIADAVDPAGEANVLAGVGLSQLSAGVAAIAVHGGLLPIKGYGAAGFGNPAAKSAGKANAGSGLSRRWRNGGPALGPQRAYALTKTLPAGMER